MQSMDEEIAVCRICRIEAEPENPLRTPCLCEGTLGNIHESCLVAWLRHSNRLDNPICELCKTSYTFVPQWADNTPTTLPYSILLVEMIKWIYIRIPTFFTWSFALFLWILVLPVQSTYIYCLFVGISHRNGDVVNQLLNPRALFIDTLTGILMILFLAALLAINTGIGEILLGESRAMDRRVAEIRAFARLRLLRFHREYLPGLRGAAIALLERANQPATAYHIRNYFTEKQMLLDETKQGYIQNPPKKTWIDIVWSILCCSQDKEHFDNISIEDTFFSKDTLSNTLLDKETNTTKSSRNKRKKNKNVSANIPTPSIGTTPLSLIDEISFGNTMNNNDNDDDGDWIEVKRKKKYTKTNSDMDGINKSEDKKKEDTKIAADVKINSFSTIGMSSTQNIDTNNNNININNTHNPPMERIIPNNNHQINNEVPYNNIMGMNNLINNNHPLPQERQMLPPLLPPPPPPPVPAPIPVPVGRGVHLAEVDAVLAQVREEDAAAALLGGGEEADVGGALGPERLPFMELIAEILGVRAGLMTIVLHWGACSIIVALAILVFIAMPIWSGYGITIFRRIKIMQDHLLPLHMSYWCYSETWPPFIVQETELIALGRGYLLILSVFIFAAMVNAIFRSTLHIYTIFRTWSIYWLPKLGRLFLLPLDVLSSWFFTDTLFISLGALPKNHFQAPLEVSTRIRTIILAARVGLLLSLHTFIIPFFFGWILHISTLYLFPNGEWDIARNIAIHDPIVSILFHLLLGHLGISMLAACILRFRTLLSYNLIAKWLGPPLARRGGTIARMIRMPFSRQFRSLFIWMCIFVAFSYFFVYIPVSYLSRAGVALVTSSRSVSSSSYNESFLSNTSTNIWNEWMKDIPTSPIYAASLLFAQLKLFYDGDTTRGKMTLLSVDCIGPKTDNSSTWIQYRPSTFHSSSSSSSTFKQNKLSLHLPPRCPSTHRLALRFFVNMESLPARGMRIRDALGFTNELVSNANIRHFVVGSSGLGNAAQPPSPSKSEHEVTFTTSLNKNTADDDLSPALPINLASEGVHGGVLQASLLAVFSSCVRAIKRSSPFDWRGFRHAFSAILRALRDIFDLAISIESIIMEELIGDAISRSTAKVGHELESLGINVSAVNLSDLVYRPAAESPFFNITIYEGSYEFELLANDVWKSLSLLSAIDEAEHRTYNKLLYENNKSSDLFTSRLWGSSLSKLSDCQRAWMNGGGSVLPIGIPHGWYYLSCDMYTNTNMTTNTTTDSTYHTPIPMDHLLRIMPVFSFVSHTSSSYKTFHHIDSIKKESSMYDIFTQANSTFGKIQSILSWNKFLWNSFYLKISNNLLALFLGRNYMQNPEVHSLHTFEHQLSGAVALKSKTLVSSILQIDKNISTNNSSSEHSKETMDSNLSFLQDYDASPFQYTIKNQTAFYSSISALNTTLLSQILLKNLFVQRNDIGNNVTNDDTYFIQESLLEGGDFFLIPYDILRSVLPDSVSPIVRSYTRWWVQPSRVNLINTRRKTLMKSSNTDMSLEHIQFLANAPSAFDTIIPLTSSFTTKNVQNTTVSSVHEDAFVTTQSQNVSSMDDFLGRIIRIGRRAGQRICKRLNKTVSEFFSEQSVIFKHDGHAIDQDTSSKNNTTDDILENQTIVSKSQQQRSFRSYVLDGNFVFDCGVTAAPAVTFATILPPPGSLLLQNSYSPSSSVSTGIWMLPAGSLAEAMESTMYGASGAFNWLRVPRTPVNSVTLVFMDTTILIHWCTTIYSFLLYYSEQIMDYILMNFPFDYIYMDVDTHFFTTVGYKVYLYMYDFFMTLGLFISYIISFVDIVCLAIINTLPLPSIYKDGTFHLLYSTASNFHFILDAVILYVAMSITRAAVRGILSSFVCVWIRNLVRFFGLDHILLPPRETLSFRTIVFASPRTKSTFINHDIARSKEKNQMQDCLWSPLANSSNTTTAVLDELTIDAMEEAQSRGSSSLVPPTALAESYIFRHVDGTPGVGIISRWIQSTGLENGGIHPFQNNGHHGGSLLHATIDNISREEDAYAELSTEIPPPILSKPTIEKLFENKYDTNATNEIIQVWAHMQESSTTQTLNRATLLAAARMEPDPDLLTVIAKELQSRTMLQPQPPTWLLTSTDPVFLLHLRAAIATDYPLFSEDIVVFAAERLAEVFAPPSTGKLGLELYKKGIDILKNQLEFARGDDGSPAAIVFSHLKAIQLLVQLSLHARKFLLSIGLKELDENNVYSIHDESTNNLTTLQDIASPISIKEGKICMHSLYPRAKLSNLLTILLHSRMYVSTSVLNDTSFFPTDPDADLISLRTQLQGIFNTMKKQSAPYSYATFRNNRYIPYLEYDTTIDTHLDKNMYTMQRLNELDVPMGIEIPPQPFDAGFVRPRRQARRHLQMRRHLNAAGFARGHGNLNQFENNVGNNELNVDEMEDDIDHPFNEENFHFENPNNLLDRVVADVNEPLAIARAIALRRAGALHQIVEGMGEGRRNRRNRDQFGNVNENDDDEDDDDEDEDEEDEEEGEDENDYDTETTTDEDSFEFPDETDDTPDEPLHHESHDNVYNMNSEILLSTLTNENFMNMYPSHVRTHNDLRVMRQLGGPPIAAPNFQVSDAHVWILSDDQLLDSKVLEARKQLILELQKNQRILPTVSSNKNPTIPTLIEEKKNFQLVHINKNSLNNHVIQPMLSFKLSMSDILHLEYLISKSGFPASGKDIATFARLRAALVHSHVTDFAPETSPQALLAQFDDRASKLAILSPSIYAFGVGIGIESSHAASQVMLQADEEETTRQEDEALVCNRLATFGDDYDSSPYSSIENLRHRIATADAFGLATGHCTQMLVYDYPKDIHPLISAKNTLTISDYNKKINPSSALVSISRSVNIARMAGLLEPVPSSLMLDLNTSIDSITSTFADKQTISIYADALTLALQRELLNEYAICNTRMSDIQNLRLHNASIAWSIHCAEKEATEKSNKKKLPTLGLVNTEVVGASAKAAYILRSLSVRNWRKQLSKLRKNKQLKKEEEEEQINRDNIQVRDPTLLLEAKESIPQIISETITPRNIETSFTLSSLNEAVEILPPMHSVEHRLSDAMKASTTNTPSGFSKFDFPLLWPGEPLLPYMLQPVSLNVYSIIQMHGLRSASNAVHEEMLKTGGSVDFNGSEELFSRLMLRARIDAHYGHMVGSTTSTRNLPWFVEHEKIRIPPILSIFGNTFENQSFSCLVCGVTREELGTINSFRCVKKNGTRKFALVCSHTCLSVLHDPIQNKQYPFYTLPEHVLVKAIPAPSSYSYTNLTLTSQVKNSLDMKAFFNGDGYFIPTFITKMLEPYTKNEKEVKQNTSTLIHFFTWLMFPFRMCMFLGTNYYLFLFLIIFSFAFAIRTGRAIIQPIFPTWIAIHDVYAFAVGFPILALVADTCVLIILSIMNIFAGFVRSVAVPTFALASQLTDAWYGQENSTIKSMQISENYARGKKMKTNGIYLEIPCTNVETLQTNLAHDKTPISVVDLVLSKGKVTNKFSRSILRTCLWILLPLWRTSSFLVLDLGGVYRLPRMLTMRRTLSIFCILSTLLVFSPLLLGSFMALIVDPFGTIISLFALFFRGISFLLNTFPFKTIHAFIPSEKFMSAVEYNMAPWFNANTQTQQLRMMEHKHGLYTDIITITADKYARTVATDTWSNQSLYPILEEKNTTLVPIQKDLYILASSIPCSILFLHGRKGKGSTNAIESISIAELFISNNYDHIINVDTLTKYELFTLFTNVLIPSGHDCTFTYDTMTKTETKNTLHTAPVLQTTTHIEKIYTLQQYSFTSIGRVWSMGLPLLFLLRVLPLIGIFGYRSRMYADLAEWRILAIFSTRAWIRLIQPTMYKTIRNLFFSFFFITLFAFVTIFIIATCLTNEMNSCEEANVQSSIFFTHFGSLIWSQNASIACHPHLLQKNTIPSTLSFFSFITNIRLFMSIVSSLTSIIFLVYSILTLFPRKKPFVSVSRFMNRLSTWKEELRRQRYITGNVLADLSPERRSQLRADRRFKHQ